VFAFFADAPGGTRVTDRVEYALPLGPLGVLAHALPVRRTLERIFTHRQERIAALLASADVASPPAPA
jgi:ligand-binding SRPBCC domain-containing protein